ncbi:type I polyketide synthase [Pelomyxa schiedti]|nr:type I polyketide synthase [Pelomyxa schiedti]
MARTGQQNTDRFLVAVTGTSCRFPTAINIDEYYNLLHSCADAVGVVPAHKLNTAVHCVSGKIKTPCAGALNDPLTHCDPAFFGLLSREASFLSPVQHQLMQISCEALADAGEPFTVVPPGASSDNEGPGKYVGVFVASFGMDWPVILMTTEADISPYTANGAALTMLSNRLSWFFDFKGPSVTVDTACSGSLVALHFAYTSLRDGDCDAALVAASNLILLPQFSLSVSRAGMTTPSGRCHTFGSNADGYVRAEGTSALFLKPLADAEANGDHIYCVISGTATNHDGSKQFINRPSTSGQVPVVQRALTVAQVDPKDVTYVEAHGTGTPVGDPIEVETLRRVFSEEVTGTRGPCFIGSVKANIGHSEAVAGLASLTKVILMLQHDEIFPQMTVPINTHIHFGSLSVSWKGQQWSKITKKRIAVANSFGFGGSNATVVVEEYHTTPRPDYGLVEKPLFVPPEESVGGKPFYFLPLSAHTTAALTACAQKWVSFLSESKCNLSEIIYSAGKRTSHFSQRLALLGRTAQDIANALDTFIQNPKGQQQATPESSWKTGTSQLLTTKNKILFVFSGQGPQWYAMGRQMFSDDRIFHDAMTQVDSIGRRIMGWSVIEELHKAESDSRVNQTQFAQVLIFAVQIGLNAVWQHWGIVPEAVVGHSVGEVAAAVVSGYLTLEEGVLVISVRSRLQQALSGKGKMLAINMSYTEASELISDVVGVDIASVNSADSVVLAGDPAALTSLEKTLKSKGKFAKFLYVQNAFHSYQTEPIKEQLLQELQGLSPAPHPKIPMISTVYAKPLTEPPGPDYWWKNVRCSVLFYPSVLYALEEKFNVFVELANHPVLSVYLSGTATSTPKNPTIIVHSIERNKPERMTLLSNLTTLYVNGITSMNWFNISNYPLAAPAAEDKARWVKIPNFPVWQNTVPLHEPKAFTAYKQASNFTHSLLGLRDDSPVPSWSNVVALNLYPWLSDHRVSAGEDIVVPGAFYCELATLAAREIWRTNQVHVKNLGFHSPVVLSPDSYVDFKCVVTDYHPGAQQMGFEVHTKAEQEKTFSRRSSCTIELITESTETALPDAKQVDIDALKATCKLMKGHSTVYKAFSDMGLNYKSLFAPITKMFVDNSNYNEALGLMKFNSSALASVARNSAVHPAVLDGCFQCIIGGLLGLPDLRGLTILLPSSLGDMQILAPLSTEGTKDFRVNIKESRFTPEYSAIEEERMRSALEENQHLVQLCKHYSALFCQAVSANSADWSPSHRKYLDWHKKLSADVVPTSVPPSYSFKVMNTEAELAHNVGKKLVDLVSNAASLFEDEHLPKFFLDSVSCNINKASVPVLAQLLQCGKRIRILEVGGGTGGATKQLLPVCQEAYNRGCDIEYIFTDASPFFVNKAKEMFSHIPFVQCSILDTTKPFPEELRDVDVMVAFAVVHVVPVLADALSRMFDAMSPGGVLLLTEPTKKDYVFLNYLFGLFDQWWQNDPADRAHVCIEREEWIKRLNSAGFSDVVSDTAGSKGIELAFASFIAQKPITGSHTFSSFWCHTKITHFVPQKSMIGEATLMDMSGKPLISVKNLNLSAISNKVANVSLGKEKWVELPLEVPPQDSPAEEAPIKKEGVLIFLSCRNEFCESLFASLISRYENVLTVERGSKTTVTSDKDTTLCIDPLNKDHWAQLVKSIGKPTTCDVVNTWPASYYTTNEPSVDELKQTSVESAMSLAYLSTALSQAELNCRLITVTKGVHDPRMSRCHTPAVSLFTLGGVARVACTETSLRLKVIDLDPCDETNNSKTHVIQELLHGWKNPVETDVCISNNRRFVERVNIGDYKESLSLLESPAEPVQPEDEGWEVQFESAGSLPHFVRINAGRPLAPTEVCTEMNHVGLNLKDSLIFKGQLGVEEATGQWYKYGKLGLEGSGVVKRVGSAVTHVKPGDEVIVLTRLGTLCSHLICNFHSVFPKPTKVSEEEASSLGVPAYTAVYSLVHCARACKGEFIMVHSASSGVGLAVMHLSKSLGLQVLATASSERELQYLREVVGLENVIAGKDPKFYQKVMELTSGRGVDIVVNTYSGTLVEKSLQILARNGRFIQLVPGQQLPRGLLTENQSIHTIELSSIPDEKLFYELGPDVMNTIASLAGVVPIQSYDLAHIQEAFDQLSNPEKRGQVSISIKTPIERLDILPSHTGTSWLCNANASYFVSGGLNGFGFAVAKWLFYHGARNVALASRDGRPKTSSDKHSIEWLKCHGCKVLCLSMDVCSYDSVASAFKVLEAEMPPVEGVYHCAALYGDCSLYNLTSEKFSRVCFPKLVGAWNLHKVTLSHPVKHFVMFSSVSSLLGRDGQASYVAGNYFMDRFVQYRHHLGLPAIAIQWGAIGDTGVLATSPLPAMSLAADGINQVSATDSLDCLYGILSTKESDSPISLFSVEMTSFYPSNRATLSLARFSENKFIDENAHKAVSGDVSVFSLLKSRVAKSLGIEEQTIGEDMVLASQGIDSLVATSLRTWIMSELGVSISPLKLLSGVSIGELASEISAMRGEPPASTAGPAATPAAATPTKPAPSVTPAATVEKPAVVEHSAVATKAQPPKVLSELPSPKPESVASLTTAVSSSVTQLVGSTTQQQKSKRIAVFGGFSPDPDIRTWLIGKLRTLCNLFPLIDKWLYGASSSLCMLVAINHEALDRLHSQHPVLDKFFQSGGSVDLYSWVQNESSCPSNDVLSTMFIASLCTFYNIACFIASALSTGDDEDDPDGNNRFMAYLRSFDILLGYSSGLTSCMALSRADSLKKLQFISAALACAQLLCFAELINEYIKQWGKDVFTKPCLATVTDSPVAIQKALQSINAECPNAPLHVCIGMGPNFAEITGHPTSIEKLKELLPEQTSTLPVVFPLHNPYYIHKPVERLLHDLQACGFDKVLGQVPNNPPVISTTKLIDLSHEDSLPLLKRNLRDGVELSFNWPDCVKAAISLKGGCTEVKLFDFGPAGVGSLTNLICSGFSLKSSIVNCMTGFVGPKPKTTPAIPQAPQQKGQVRKDTLTPEQQIVYEWWCEVLAAPPETVDEDFFEAGGDSVAAIKFIACASKGGWKLEIKDLFQCRTLRTITELLPSRKASKSTSIVQQPHAMQRPPKVPLSYTQMRLFFIDQLDPNSVQYSTWGALVLKGAAPSTSLLQQATLAAVQRHESLRTLFVMSDGDDNPHQLILPPEEAQGGFEFTEFVYDGLQDDEQHKKEQWVLKGCMKEVHRPFNLQTGPLLRFSVFRVSKEETVLFVNAHHIIVDGWSFVTFAKEISYNYNRELALSKLTTETAKTTIQPALLPPPLPALPFQYADFSLWQRELLQSTELKDEQLSYWKKELECAPEVCELPLDRPRGTHRTYAAGTHTHIIAPALFEELCSVGHTCCDATPFMTVLSMFLLLLHLHTPRHQAPSAAEEVVGCDVVVGIPTANRHYPGVESLIGFFANTLAIRLRITEDKDLESVLKQVKEKVLAAQGAQDIPFDWVVEAIGVGRKLNTQPLVQVMFIMDDWDVGNPNNFSLEGIQAANQLSGLQAPVTKFDLTLHCYVANKELHMEFEYAKDILDDSTIQRMGANLEALMKSVAKAPSQGITKMLPISVGEIQQLEQWNATEKDIRRGGVAVHHLFEEKVAERPKATALKFMDSTVTYEQLNSRANQLAHHLIATGKVGPGIFVPIVAERSIEMYVAVYAVLKAGSAYIPLDPESPSDRLSSVFADSQPPFVLLSKKSLSKCLPSGSPPTISVLEDSNLWESQPTCNPPHAIKTGQEPIYAILTSGSTGKPKLAVNNHIGAVNHGLWLTQKFGVTSDSRFLVKAPFYFDASVADIFFVLIAGACGVLCPLGSEMDPEALLNIVSSEKITWIFFVPAVLKEFISVARSNPNTRQMTTSLKLVYSGGDALQWEEVVRFVDTFGPQVQLFNVYGPSEASCGTTSFDCTEALPSRNTLYSSSPVVPLGRPIDNVTVFVLDRNLKPVPVGVVGEIYIGGISVGMGYMNRDDLNAKHFVSSPPTLCGGKLYRTGDLGSSAA